MWTYSWCTQIDKIHWDSSFIMTLSGPFLITRTSRADYSFSPLADPSLHERTFLCFMRGPFFITRKTSARRARTSFVCADHSLSYPDHLHSRGSRRIFSGYFRFACDPSLNKRTFLFYTFYTISIMTCAHRVDSLGPINGSVTRASRAGFFRSRGTFAHNMRASSPYTRT